MLGEPGGCASCPLTSTAGLASCAAHPCVAQLAVGPTPPFLPSCFPANPTAPARAPPCPPAPADAASFLHSLLRRTPWRAHARVVAFTPDGLAMTQPEAQLLPVLSNMSVVSWADFSRRLPPDYNPQVRLGLFGAKGCQAQQLIAQLATPQHAAAAKPGFGHHD